MSAVLASAEAPRHFQLFADAQEYLALREGGEPSAYPRDAAHTMEAARRLGVERQVAEAIAASRELEPAVVATVKRAVEGEGSVVSFDRGGESALPRGRGIEEQRHRWPNPLELDVLAKREPVPPRYIIPDRLPVGCATGIWGDGGTAKSQTALMMAVCLASWTPFMGVEVERRRVVILCCEDSAEVLHWRLRCVCKHLRVELASLRGWLDVLDLTGHDAVLWRPDRGGGCLTPAYAWLRELIDDPDVVLIIDGIADTFGGSENDRGEVKRYINAVLGLIDRTKGAAMLLGHVDKMAARSPKSSLGFSGSTQWHNAVRSRWYMYAETDTDTAESEPTGVIILEFRKNQYGRNDLPPVRLTWNVESGLYAPDQGAAAVVQADRLSQDRDEQAGILAALRACCDVDYVPAATSGRRTAYHVLEASNAFPATLRGKRPAVRRFWRHIEVLRLRGDIKVAERRGRDRHSISILLPAGNAAL